MGGICGWVGAGGRPGGVAPAPVIAALAHRREVAWLDDAAGAPRAVADGSWTTPERLGEAWSARSHDPAGFVSDLPGSFAVAALDRPRRRLLLARDRLGEKPLYYASGPAGIAFASEIKALRALEGTVALPALTLAAEALDAYLAFTYIPAPWTIFEQVRKVPAGHCLIFDLAAAAPIPAEAIRYWSLPPRTGEKAGPDAMLAMLAAALRRRLPAEGKPGCYLSGGLDSSVVAALMAREGIGAFPAFTIAFKEEALDESAHARRVAKLAGAEHHVILMEEIDPATVSAVVEQLDEPMADAATLPSWILAREAARSARVVMTGDGADALLAGDHWFRRLRRLDALERLPRPARALPGLMGARWKELVSLLDQPPAARYLSIRQKWSAAERRAIYAQGLRGRAGAEATEASYLRSGVTWNRGASVDAALRLDAIHGLPEDLLMKADKMGMAHGVESRSPFLDREFAEWCARLDIGLLLKGARSKHLLKEAAAALLPRDLVHRRKHGFQVPVARWLKGPLRPLTEAAFDPRTLSSQGLFDPGALALLKGQFEQETPSPALAGRVWQIVAFQTWWRGPSGRPRG